MIDQGYAFATDTSEAPKEGININTSNSSPLPDPVLTDRAKRADFALGADSPGPQVLRDEFRQGNETSVREQAAAKANSDFKQDKLDTIDKIVKSGNPVSANDINTIMAVGQTPEANPATVFEDKYGKNVVTGGIVGEPGTNLVFQTAMDKIPEQTNDAARLGMAAVSRKMQIKGLLEETQAAYDKQSWIDPQGYKAGNFVANLFTGGIAQYVNQRNLLNSDPENMSYLPGSNKLEQIQWLYLQPNPEQILRRVAGPGSEFFRTNPADALDFIRSAHQFSTSDALVDNMFGVVNVGTLLPIGSAIKIGARAFKGVSAAPPIVATAADIAEGNAISVLRGSPTPPVTPGEKAAGVASDILGQSAKAPERGYYYPEAALKGTPDIQMKNGIPTVKTTDGVEVVPSRAPQEGHVRIEATEPTPFNQYRTKEGVQDYTPGNPEVTPDHQTIYLTRQQLDKWNTIAPNSDKNHVILNDDKGYFLGDMEPSATKGPGREVRGTRIQPATEPARGLYPVHVGEGTEAPVIGARITSVTNGSTQNYKLTKIVTPVEKDMRAATADIVKAQGNELPEDVLAKMGQQKTASEISANKQIAETQSETLPLGDTAQIRSRVPTNAQPVPYYNDASSLAWRRANDIVNEFQAGLSATRVERLPPTAFNAMISLAKQAVSKYNRVSADAIRDQVTHWDHMTNTYALETRIGKPNGELFDSRANADFYRTMQYRMGKAATTEQEGNKFYISHVVHGDETQSMVRDSLTIGNETPASFFNSMYSLATGKVGPNLRSSAYTQSQFARTGRTTATHAPSVLRDIISEKAEALGAMSKNERNELRDILVHNRDYIPPGKSGESRGFFYTSEQEFRDAFYNRFQKQASDTQWNAYERFTRLSDLDWVLRESENMRDVVRQGVRNYAFKFENRDGQKISTDDIKGKEVPDFYPLVTPDANVYVLPTNKYTSKYGLKDGSSDSKEVLEKIKSGEYKIVQMYDPRSKPLMEATGIKEDIHFVVTNKFEDSPVRWGENVLYRPGGHVIYVPQHYVKQPQIGIGQNGRPTYYGDVALKAFNTQKEAEFWADRYTQSQQFIKNGDTAGFDAYVSKNLPETPAELKAMFDNGAFNTEHPFMHAVSGRSTLESNEKFVANNPTYRGLKDTFTAYNLAQNEERAFLADRGTQLNTVANKGTEANPVWHNVEAELMDPYSALGKGLSQVVRSRWMADEKIRAAESWLQEFGHLFDQAKLPQEKLRLNPMYYLYNTDAVNKAVIKANPEAFAAMMTSRDNILRFIGSKDEVGSMIDGLNLSLINRIDKNFGNKWAARAEIALPGIRNIPQYMRTATFDMVDGLFNIVQLPQQALGFTNAIAIAPEHAARSMSAWWIANRMKYTEDAAILSSWGDAATKMGWKKNDFMEAYQAWKDSGTHQIGGEVSARSTFDDPVLFKSLWGSFVDKGRMFFKKGEEINRDVSFFTAYAEARAAEPNRVLDNRMKTEIQARFDTLSMNMTRASNAAYNEGVLSLPTQFWTWNARHFEQMASFGANRQLTIAEKSRVLGMNSLLYGIPSALGGATFGLNPLAVFGVPGLNFDDIRQFAIKQGINLHDNFVSAITKGLPEMALNAVTGWVTGQKGDIDLHRFSPNADQLRIFDDIKTGKKEWPELFFGASGSMVYKVIAATQPFLTYTMSAFSSNAPFPIRANDLVNAGELVSSFNNAEKMWMGLNYGQYWSKSNQLQASDVDKFESILLGMGLSLNRVSDAWEMKSIDAAKESAQKKVEKRVMEDASLAMDATGRGDTQTFDTSMARIHALMAGAGYTHKEERDLFKKAMRNHGSLVDQMNQKWLKSGPGMNDSDNVKKFFENMER